MEQQKLESAQTAAGSRSADKKRKITVGSIWPSNNCGDFEVVELNGCEDILIRFVSTGYEVRVQAGNLKRGWVKDHLLPTVCGVGFIGTGEFKSRSEGKITKHYDAWKNMLSRCYDTKTQEKHPTYIGCTVCEEWHNFQNFSRWYHENYPILSGDYQIDKDLKIPGNKVYSPDTCMFVNPVVNGFIVSGSSSLGKRMIGVTFEESRGKFISQCCNPFTNRQRKVGRFSTEVEAHLAWRKRKSELAYELAMNQERDEVKLALLNWRSALDNFEIHGSVYTMCCTSYLLACLSGVEFSESYRGITHWMPLPEPPEAE